ncbi:MAG: response regulator [Deltaproteobacteria bacterium]|nr:response regulator [Deltaproteobacteria bacterium]
MTNSPAAFALHAHANANTVTVHDFDSQTPASGVHMLPLAGVRVLVVDDDARVLKATANALSRIGFHVITADDGGPALQLAETTPPDLVLVDLNMPTYGLDVVRRLKALYGAAVWVAVLSGHDDEETRSQCFEAGADDVLVKPAAGAELRRRVIAAARMQQAFVEARLAQEQIERRLAYGSEATALLAHDLNNGLAVALSNMSYLSEAVQLPEDEASALRASLRALRKMSGLVSNFVDIARFEDAAVKPQCAQGNVRAVLADVMDVHANSLDRRIAFEIECDPDMLANFDVALVERVLHNLVGNATRYCAQGGRIRMTATRTEDSCDRSVEIRISNDGPCVPKDLEGNLFAKYAKGKTGKRGFGLYFCRLACEAHGGSIEYTSSSGGPTFVVRLPGRS